MRITARSRGAAVVGTNVKYLVRAIQGALQEVSINAAYPIKEEAKALCPVDTGALQESIDSTVIESTPNRCVVRIAPDTPYAAYVEYGTGIRGAGSPGAGKGPYSATWPGMPAQPYMRPAWDGKQAEAAAILKDTLRETVVGAVVDATNEAAARRNARLAA